MRSTWLIAAGLVCAFLACRSPDEPPNTPPNSPVPELQKPSTDPSGTDAGAGSTTPDATKEPKR
jgi:hypothetical protein